MENEIAIKESGISFPAAQSATQTMLQTREMTEIQAMVISAKRFPRDLSQVRADILASCDSPALAEISQYAYAKGGTEITGPSIRLAEEVACAFQNIDKGWIELERKPSIGNVPGESLIQCFAWDMQRNVKAKRTFTVRHWRDTKKGGYALKDEREIYELCANQAARRLRACILEIIPKFIVDEAIDRCEQTLKKATGPMNTEIPRMLTAFEKIGVTKDMIEKRVQRKVETIDSTQFGSLRKIYQSLVDGMSKLDQWFEIAPGGESAPAQQEPTAPAPSTQSIGKKTATNMQENAKKEPPRDQPNQSGPQGPAMDREARTAPAIKNSAPTKAEIEAKKSAAANRVDEEDAFFPMSDNPPPVQEELPTFIEIWKDIGKAATAKWPAREAPDKVAELCKTVCGKGPKQLQAENDIKGFIKVYETLLKIEGTK